MKALYGAPGTTSSETVQMEIELAMELDSLLSSIGLENIPQTQAISTTSSDEAEAATAANDNSEGGKSRPQSYGKANSLTRTSTELFGTIRFTKKSKNAAYEMLM